MGQTTKTDIAVIGGGIAGSLVAGMLHKFGINHVLIDPREEYPDEFRAEKFNAEQISLMHQTGVASKVFEKITPVSDVWLARFGRLVRKRQFPHYGFSYCTVVNALRENFAHDPRRFIQASVINVHNSSNVQTVELSDGSEIHARLVVLASGANQELQGQLGFDQTMLSQRHCLAIGFDVEPKDGPDFEYDTMTYWPESASDRMSYLTFFRCGKGWRANMFGYWSIKDERIQTLKSDPEACLNSLMPNLERIVGSFKVAGKLRVRPIDLYQWNADNVDGIVAIGDAWSSSCPGAGTGTTKAMNDAIQLCQTHIPQWLATDGMNARKIANFYENSEKRRIDGESLSEAYKLRSLTLDKSAYWHMQRWGRFLYHGLRGRLATA